MAPLLKTALHHLHRREAGNDDPKWLPKLLCLYIAQPIFKSEHKLRNHPVSTPCVYWPFGPAVAHSAVTAAVHAGDPMAARSLQHHSFSERDKRKKCSSYTPGALVWRPFILLKSYKSSKRLKSFALSLNLRRPRLHPCAGMTLFLWIHFWKCTRSVKGWHINILTVLWVPGRGWRTSD